MQDIPVMVTIAWEGGAYNSHCIKYIFSLNKNCQYQKLN